MTKQEVLDKLKIDEHYYGDFGKQYLSNSDIMALLNNPLALGQQSKPSAAFLVGGYFHTAILEPNKLDKFKIVKSSTRNTKAYKDVAGGELCLLQHEVDTIELMRDKLMANNVCKSLIASKYNYDSQAYIYSSLFGYEFMFIVIDKKTHQIGIYDCSPKFYESGQDKVKRAVEAYDLFYKTDSFDPKQYFISKTL